MASRAVRSRVYDERTCRYNCKILGIVRDAGSLVYCGEAFQTSGCLSDIRHLDKSHLRHEDPFVLHLISATPPEK